MSYFIPQKSLKNLKKYKYASEDRSLLTKYVLKKFWVQFEQIFPEWMAPNMVTLLGLVFIITALSVVFYFDPDFNTASPSWTYYFYGFCIFMYQTFDACDGLHARRTGQSGPLGELFDHCCDAVNTTLSVLIFASVIGSGKGWLLYAMQFSAMTNFYLSTWEEWYTHKLFLSEFSGPVEGIAIIVTTCNLTGYFGQDATWKNVRFDVDLSSIGGPESQPVDILLLSMTAGGIILLFNIYSAVRNAVASLDDPEDKKEAQLNVLPFFFYYATVFALVALYPTVLVDHATQMVFTIGATMAYVVGRIISTHLTIQDFPTNNAPTLFPILQLIAIQILTKVYKFELEWTVTLVVYTGLGLALAAYGFFVFEIIYDITTYLDIWALAIKHPQRNTRSKKTN